MYGKFFLMVHVIKQSWGVQFDTSTTNILCMVDSISHFTCIPFYFHSIQRWLKLASAYAESPLRVGCLEWPLKVSPKHALQLQASAAFRLITPVKSRHSQPGSSSLLLHQIPMKSLNPARHDSAIWNDALRYTNYLSGTSVCQQDHTPSLLLEAYRLARKHSNLKLATALIQNHIFCVVGPDSDTSDLGLTEAVELLKKSTNITPKEKFHVMRDLAKLHACLGQTSLAIDSLVTSTGVYSELYKNEHKLPGDELTGRSLLTLVKWLQSEPRFLTMLWRSDIETGKKLDLLLSQELKYRREQLGLYYNSATNESWELFEPDESVAKYKHTHTHTHTHMHMCLGFHSYRSFCLGGVKSSI